MRWRRARSCMRYTAATATRANSRARPRPRPTSEISRHEPRHPMNAAAMEVSLPSNWYHDEAIFKIEKERLFCREWICVGRDEELPKPGDHLVLDVLGESILLLRSEGRRVGKEWRCRGSPRC